MIHQYWQYYIVCFLCIKYEYACISPQTALPPKHPETCSEFQPGNLSKYQKLNQGTIGGGFQPRNLGA